MNYPNPISKSGMCLSILEAHVHIFFCVFFINANKKKTYN
jgi:hypothetical protein